MDSIVSAPLFSFVLFVSMILCVEVGRRMGKNYPAGQKKDKDGFGAADGAIYGLFGLLIAFTFSGAATRFDTHRELIAEEANAISTAYLRIDLLPAASQPAMREEFRNYLDLRLEGYRALPNRDAANTKFAQAEAMQERIWKDAVAATMRPGSHPDAAKLLLPAINNMIDITVTRRMALAMHPPVVILLLLFTLGLASAFLLGLNLPETGKMRYVHVLGYALITALTIFIIVDLEYPRAGLIRADSYDQVLVKVRANMR